MISCFDGRSLAIATMHQKEKVLAPLLERALGLKCQVLAKMDTDQFGTFSGEVPRNQSIFQTAASKCDFAHKHFHCDLVLASEGTFGPHPSIPFVPSDHEYLLMKDYVNNLEIAGSALSLMTNFNQQEVATLEELLNFASSVGFPSHGVILRPARDSLLVYKGIDNECQLAECFTQLVQLNGKAWAETDMRAQFNPTRLKVIAEAAEDLIRQIFSPCPSCGSPGFSVSESKAGLPCQLCGKPTRSILKNILICKRCSYRTEELFPSNKQMEDPMHCDFCNP